jgi:hypothetical protein
MKIKSTHAIVDVSNLSLRNTRKRKWICKKNWWSFYTILSFYIRHISFSSLQNWLVRWGLPLLTNIYLGHLSSNERLFTYSVQHLIFIRYETINSISINTNNLPLQCESIHSYGYASPQWGFDTEVGSWRESEDHRIELWTIT